MKVWKKEKFRFLIFGLILFFSLGNIKTFSSSNSNYSTNEPLYDGTSSPTEADTGINSGGGQISYGTYKLVSSLGGPVDEFSGSTSTGEPQIKSGFLTYDQLKPKILSTNSVLDRNSATSGTDITYFETPSTLYAEWTNVFSDLESGIRKYRYDISTNSSGNDLPTNRGLWRKSTANSSTTIGSITSSEFGSTFTPGTTYYFCVVAENTAGFFSDPVCSNGVTIASIELTIVGANETTSCTKSNPNDCPYDFGSVDALDTPIDSTTKLYRGAKINIDVTPDNLSYKFYVKANNSDFSNGTNSISLSKVKYKFENESSTSYKNLTTNFSGGWDQTGDKNDLNPLKIDYQLTLDLFDPVGTDYLNSISYEARLSI